MTGSNHRLAGASLPRAGVRITKSLVIALLTGALGLSIRVGVLAQQGDDSAETTVEADVWQGTEDAGVVWVTVRGEGGEWARPEHVAFDRETNSGRYVVGVASWTFPKPETAEADPRSYAGCLS